MARARLVSERGSTLTPPFSIFTTMSSGTTYCRAPFGPFILTVWPSMLAVTPDGTETAFLPMRDMTVPLEHRAEDLAAHIGVAGGMVRHHAFGGRDDCHAEAVVDARQFLRRRIDAAPRLGDALDDANDRRAVEILKLDLELGAAVAVLHRGIVADVAFGLEHLEHALAQLRTRRRHFRLGPGLGVADAGDHVADWIVQIHAGTPHQLDLTRPGISPLAPNSRMAMRLIFSLR